jgi:hypothetical protein
MDAQVVDPKLVSFGLMEGTNVHNGITIQIKCDMAFFSMHVHYIVHQINLVVKPLSI